MHMLRCHTFDTVQMQVVYGLSMRNALLEVSQRVHAGDFMSRAFVQQIVA